MAFFFKHKYSIGKITDLKTQLSYLWKNRFCCILSFSGQDNREDCTNYTILPGVKIHQEIHISCDLIKEKQMLLTVIVAIKVRK